MNEEKNLGVYWGSNALFFVETQKTTATNIFQVPFGEAVKETLKNGPSGVGGIELGSDVQKILRQHHLSGSAVNLSLPAKDIIFRSFVIPWMEAHEVMNVVEFEAGKYVPFALEKLSFSFYPISFNENNTKRLRIIFVAIKSDTLTNYIRILESTSLHINVIEPAPSSLVRALSLKLKSVIPKDQTIALIEKEDVGRITIVDRDIPQFVREFYLTATGAHNPEEKMSEELIRKLTGEVRISLDYFNRQNEQLQVTHAVLLSASNLKELSQTLEKNLPISVIPIDDQTILGDPSKSELGYLNAYGTSIIPAVGSSLHFNLAKQKPTLSSRRKLSVPKKPINYKSIIKTALVCVPLIIGSIVVCGITQQNIDEEISALNQKLGRFQDTDVAMIEQNEKTLQDNLAYFKNIRLESHAASFLLFIPSLLPEGTWISNLDITYDDSASFKLPGDAVQAPVRRFTQTGSPDKAPTLSIIIEGYAYSENRNQQFRLVNQLLRNLKDNQEFSGFFSEIDVETTKAEQLNNFPVTAFKIVCTRDDEPKRP